MKLPLNRLVGGALLVPLLIVAGCNQDNPPDSAMDAPTPAEPSEPSTPPANDTTVATTPNEVNLPASTVPTGAASQTVQVSLQPTEGNTASGTLAMSATDDGLHLTGTLRGLKPDSAHGFHIHETGDCSAPDASSAGGHFTAQGEPHGQPGTPPHHTGDMPNQRADAEGSINVDVRLSNVELGTGGATDVAGRAIVLHQKADDYTSQPSGDSGSRIACGVITMDAAAAPAEPATDAASGDQPPLGG